MTTITLNDCTESLNELKKDAALIQKRGLPFMMASVILWAAIMVSRICMTDITEMNFFTFCCSAMLMPLATLFGAVV